MSTVSPFHEWKTARSGRDLRKRFPACLIGRQAFAIEIDASPPSDCAWIITLGTYPSGRSGLWLSLSDLTAKYA